MPLTDQQLLSIEKPARYLGGELHMVEKNPETVDIQFAFCFPDVYEVGMSHLGLSILYYFLNRREDTHCQRAFAPWHDMEALMRREGVPLSALESGKPLKDFDFVGFTLQYEMSYTNLLNMLDLSGIPLYAHNRGEGDPIICAGGPCAYNPEPLADFIDFFYLGEGEAMLDAVLDAYKQNKQAGGTRLDFLTALLDLEGIYVPQFYDVTYKPNGEIAAVTPNHPKAKPVITKVMPLDLNETFAPTVQMVPNIETVHDRVSLELFRGCMRGCRFCQAGYVYRPMREKGLDNLVQQAEALTGCTGHEEISLVSLSTSDYSQFHPLVSDLLDKYQSRHVNLSLPSQRIDAFSPELAQKVQGGRKSGLTFAPEAGSQRMRDVINKRLTEADILNGVTLAFENGWERMKLYFMMGLPTETEEDLIGIVTLAEKVVSAYYGLGKKGRQVNVNVSVSCFVPKPFTPFQWEAQDTAQAFKDKQALMKRALRKKQIKLSFHDPFVSVMEGVLARGDRRLAAVLEKAWALGARFDGWSECFKADLWQQAFAETGVNPDFYTHRQRSTEEVLPWGHISVGVSQQYFIKEREKALAAQFTQNCREGCTGCGIQNLSLGGGVCHGL